MERDCFLSANRARSSTEITARSPRALAALGLCMGALLSSGCAPLFRLQVRPRPEANEDRPIALAVVTVYDQKLLPMMLGLSARQWFDQRAELLQDHAADLQEDLWEFVPGQAPRALQRPLRRWWRPSPSSIAFIGYEAPGPHRFRFEPCRVLRLRCRTLHIDLQRERYAISIR